MYGAPRVSQGELERIQRRSPPAKVARGQVSLQSRRALPLMHGLHKRSRRANVRSKFSGCCGSGTPSTTTGVLIYLLLADRDVEIVADRGVAPRL